jgi:hypothetical protein
MALLPLVGPWPLFRFLYHYAVGRTPWTGDKPVAMTLPTHRTTQTHTDIRALSGIRTYDHSVWAKEDGSSLRWCAAIVIGAMDIQIQIILISALVRDKWPASSPWWSPPPGTPWPREPVWTTWRKNKSFLYRNANSDRSAVQPVASRYIPTELSRLPGFPCTYINTATWKLIADWSCNSIHSWPWVPAGGGVRWRHASIQRLWQWMPEDTYISPVPNKSLWNWAWLSTAINFTVL